MPVAERRAQLIEAAMTVASRDGIDAATVRAVAAEAGVSLGVVHYCFQDKAELMRAMAHAITAQNSPTDLSTLPAGIAIEDAVQAVVDAFWQAISRTRGAQLLSYELTTASLRHAELRDVALEQYRGQWATGEAILAEVARVAGVRWTADTAALARIMVAAVDGIALAWLVDEDDAASRGSIEAIGRFIATLTEPADQAPAAGPDA
ncbi:TetR family transcriptional regulator [Cellulomonas sp.]|uniref:TetR/AcrR family transcriptional regulator n=1 Tax=Cellulomonas sp. TaxID=40001 RepID=UPI00258BC6EF|nr:TetR family transcriptional regulator [Cellulomonas sp.]MCR6688228.1 TetR family transcriptional regulator [Cellulomonas sp.]